MDNKLCLKSGYIILEGFELIKDVATFCVYPGGIIISAGSKRVDRRWYCEVQVGENRTVQDETLFQLLRDRGLEDESLFAQIGNDYFEFCPHSIR